MNINRVGVDIAKNVFHLCAVTRWGEVVWRKKYKRNQWLAELERLVEPGVTVGMEACSGAHHWCRELERRGYPTRMIAAQFVKPYVKSNKTDHADAEAIAEAMSRPSMRFVALKTINQQDIQATHRIRDELIQRRTALVNQIRGLVGEYGLVAPQSLAPLRRALTDWLDEEQGALTMYFKQLLLELREDLVRADERVKDLDRHIQTLAKSDPVAQKLMELRGVGVICATIMSSALGNGSGFRSGREFAVSLGLTPKQHSTGGKETLLGISKRGDSYIRKQLVHGARSALRTAGHYDDALSHWLHRLSAKKHPNVVTVALAAKTARMAWALVHHETHYDPSRAAAAPIVA